MRIRMLWQVTGLLLVNACLPCDLPAQHREEERVRDVERYRDGHRGEGSETRSTGSRRLSSQPDHIPYWYLGVEVEYRDHGAQVTRVERHSPAQRSGLELRDVIVTVNGYQVGRVSNRLYPLERELELRADRRGQVRLLVLSGQSGQLSSIGVKLQRAEHQRDPLRSEQIIGTITSRNVSSLDRDATLTIHILDVTDRRLPARTIARRTYRDLGPLPIPFELTYDATHIQSGHRYAIDAEISINGFTAFRTGKHYPVLETERQGRVHVVLEPVRH